MASKARLHHAHGCVQCSGRYQDTCDTPQVNGRCQECRTGHARLLWERNADPVACCYSQSVKAGPVERDKYGLAGDGEWWICRGCSRTHPYPIGVSR